MQIAGECQIYALATQARVLLALEKLSSCALQFSPTDTVEVVEIVTPWCGRYKLLILGKTAQQSQEISQQYATRADIGAVCTEYIYIHVSPTDGCPLRKEEETKGPPQHVLICLRR